ncbi:hypothetical protein DFH09DRAFT_1336260 [Mycena vulgaris]|nr:hypothetical protein DFH09DRAFT_1336260 [Mycena vulgaris]
MLIVAAPYIIIRFLVFPPRSQRVSSALRVVRPSTASAARRATHQLLLDFCRSRHRCNAYLNASALLHQCARELPANAFDASDLQLYTLPSREHLDAPAKAPLFKCWISRSREQGSAYTPKAACLFALRHAINAPPTFKFWISRFREVAFALLALDALSTPAHVSFGFRLPASAVTAPSTRRAAWCSCEQVRAKLVLAPPPSGQQRAINTLDLQSPQATVHFVLPPAAIALSHHERPRQHLNSEFRVPATEIAFAPRPRHFILF